MEFFDILRERNQVMWWFGMLNLLVALGLVVLSVVKPVEFGGTNAWFKPIKFALSTVILSWSLGWYSGYLPAGRDVQWVNWIIVVTLAFEVIYIAMQAARGQASHFNVSTPGYSLLFSLMAIAASVATLAVGYLGWKFFASPFPDLPDYYLWAIRLGLVLFFIFSFEGFAMGARLAHSVGGPDGSQGIFFLNWSRIFGDLRVAHFIGMHALQILPILAWYLLRDLRLTLVLALLYGLLALFVLVQALQAKSFLSFIP